MYVIKLSCYWFVCWLVGLCVARIIRKITDIFLRFFHVVVLEARNDPVDFGDYLVDLDPEFVFISFNIEMYIMPCSSALTLLVAFFLTGDAQLTDHNRSGSSKWRWTWVNL